MKNIIKKIINFKNKTVSFFKQKRIYCDIPILLLSVLIITSFQTMKPNSSSFLSFLIDLSVICFLVGTPILFYKKMFKTILKFISPNWLLDRESQKILKKIHSAFENKKYYIKHLEKDPNLLKTNSFFSILFEIDEETDLGLEFLNSWCKGSPLNAFIYKKNTGKIINISSQIQEKQNLIFEIQRILINKNLNKSSVSNLCLLMNLPENAPPSQILETIKKCWESNEVIVSSLYPLRAKINCLNYIIELSEKEKSFNIKIISQNQVAEINSTDLNNGILNYSFTYMHEFIHEKISKNNIKMEKLENNVEIIHSKKEIEKKYNWNKN